MSDAFSQVESVLDRKRGHCRNQAGILRLDEFNLGFVSLTDATGTTDSTAPAEKMLFAEVSIHEAGFCVLNPLPDVKPRAAITEFFPGKGILLEDVFQRLTLTAFGFGDSVKNL